MLYNVPEISIDLGTVSEPDISEATYEKLDVPAVTSPEGFVKAGYSRSLHTEGMIVNNSGSSSTASTLYIMLVAAGAAPPDKNDILQTGTILPAYGSIFHIPKKANVDIYLTSNPGLNGDTRCVYFNRE